MRQPIFPQYLLSHPVGSIRTRDEVRDLVIEARKTKRAIRLYLVQQSGYLSEFFIASKSRLNKPKEGSLCSGDNFYCLTGWTRSSFDKKYYRSDMLMGSFSIGVSGGNGHFAFTNKIAAEKYSSQLKNDATYMKYVKDWHAYCSHAFSF
jgi:hypothetical protein